MHERFTSGGPVPESIGALADLYTEVRDLRLAMDKAAGAVKERETQIKDLILHRLQESPDTGAAGDTTRVQLVQKTVRNVKDWDTFLPWVAQYGQWQLLGRSTNSTAMRELFEQYNQLPPGVTAEDIDQLSFSKV